MRGETPRDQTFCVFSLFLFDIKGPLCYFSSVPFKTMRDIGKVQEVRIDDPGISGTKVSCFCRIFLFFQKKIPEDPAPDPRTGKGESMKKVGIVMGSKSDLPVVEKAAQVLKDFGIPVEMHIYSAHRTPEEARAFALSAADNGFGVIIAAAGMAAHLAGAMAANTILPVIGIPCKSAALDGMDALLSTVQMPSGIPVATVAIDGAKNAGYLAAEILAVSDESLAGALREYRAQQAAEILRKDKELNA